MVFQPDLFCHFVIMFCLLGIGARGALLGSRHVGRTKSRDGHRSDQWYHADHVQRVVCTRAGQWGRDPPVPTAEPHSRAAVVNPLGYGDRIVRAGETDPVFAVPTLARAAALHTELDEAKIIEHRALILDLVRSFQRAHARKNEGVYAQYGALRYASNRYVGSIFRLIPSYSLFPSYGLLTPQAIGISGCRTRPAVSRRIGPTCWPIRRIRRCCG